MKTSSQTEVSFPAFGDSKGRKTLARATGLTVLLAVLSPALHAEEKIALENVHPSNRLAGITTTVTQTHTVEPEFIDPDLLGEPDLELPEEAANEREGLSYSVGPYDFTELKNFSRTPTKLTAETLDLPTIVVDPDSQTDYLEVTSPERRHPTATGLLMLYGVIIDYIELE